MKSIISLFVEIKRNPGQYESFHYSSRRSSSNWFKLPLNFVNAIKVVEANGCNNIKNVTAEEIALNDCESWVIVRFDSEGDFVKAVEYRLS